MKYKNKIFILIAAAGILLEGCSSTPNLDEKFGQSLNSAKDAMRLKPNNEDTLPSHVELIQPLEKYQKREATSLPTVINSK
jgi:PBP1b-binding outer membrane lipoprotein LpoB